MSVDAWLVKKREGDFYESVDISPEQKDKTPGCRPGTWWRVTWFPAVMEDVPEEARVNLYEIIQLSQRTVIDDYFTVDWTTVKTLCEQALVKVSEHPGQYDGREEDVTRFLQTWVETADYVLEQPDSEDYALYWG